MKQSIDTTASHVVHEMERYLDALGTIAVISPLLGLLGTVLGMINVFADIMLHGTGNASVLAGGISQALVTTVAGLIVAIPTVIMHRYFLRRVDSVVVEMEQQTIRLMDALHGERAVKVVDGVEE
jgi:biopolymer transport protein ExbB